MRLLICFFISFLVQANPNISFKNPLILMLIYISIVREIQFLVAKCYLEMEHLFII